MLRLCDENKFNGRTYCITCGIQKPLRRYFFYLFKCIVNIVGYVTGVLPNSIIIAHGRTTFNQDALDEECNDYDLQVDFDHQPPVPCCFRVAIVKSKILHLKKRCTELNCPLL